MKGKIQGIRLKKQNTTIVSPFLFLALNQTFWWCCFLCGTHISCSSCNCVFALLSPGTVWKMRHYKYNTTQCIAEYSHQPSAVSPELTLGKLNHLGALRTIVFTEVSVCVCVLRCGSFCVCENKTNLCQLYPQGWRYTTLYRPVCCPSGLHTYTHAELINPRGSSERKI